MSTYSGIVTAGSVVAIPDAVLKVHVNDLLWSAMPAMRYDQFAVVKRDLTKTPGDTIVFSKYSDITGGGAISESSDLTLTNMSKSSISIQVTEYMNGVGITGKLLSLAFRDEMTNHSIALGRNYARVTDDMLRDAVFSGSQTIYANSKDNINQVADALALDDIDEAVETLETANVLKFIDPNGEFYVCFATPHQVRNLRKELLPIKQYAYPEHIFKGEIGEYNGVRFVVTTNCPNGDAPNTDSSYSAALNKVATPALQANLHKAAIIGPRAYGWAVALDVELREDPGYSNFGRKRGVAYYAIQGAGKINNEEIVVLVSA